MERTRDTVLEVDGVRRAGEPDKAFREGVGRLQGHISQRALREDAHAEQQRPCSGRIGGRRNPGEEPIRQIDQLVIHRAMPVCGRGAPTGHDMVDLVAESPRRRHHLGAGQREPLRINELAQSGKT